MNIGQRIVRFREQKGLSTNKLANECGLSQSFLRDVELSNKNISVENLNLICTALNISLYDFFYEPAMPEQIEQELIQTIQTLSSEQQYYLLKLLKH